MDIISFSEAATANGRIEKINANPDSTSGIVTVPKVIASGETVTIPAGRIAVLPNVQVDGVINIEGEVFIPSGATFSKVVETEGNQTIAGVKTFSSSPVVPTPTTETQAVNKLYIDGKYSGFKNYIINGCMRVAQRGVGPFTTNGYGIDQWFSYISATTSNVQRNWNGTGSNHPSYAQIAVGVGTDIITMEQRLEHPHRFSGKTLTLSMMLVNSDIIPYTGANVPYEIALAHAGGRTLLLTGNITFSSTSRVSVTFTVPDLSGYTLNANSYFEIRPVSMINRGYTGVFGIGDVQLEEGSIATPFEQRPYGLELSLCQRYFYNFNNYDALYRIIKAVGLTTIPFPVSMRTAPTITYRLEKDGIPHTVNSGASVIQSNNDGIVFMVDPANYTTIVDVMYFTASSEL